MQKILLLSPYWKESHRWMVSSYKLAELWQRMGYHVTVVCMASETGIEHVSDTLTIHRRKDIFLKDPLNFGIAFGFAGYVRRRIKEIKPDHIIVNKVLFWTSFATIPLALSGHKILLLTDALVGITWQPRNLIPKIIMTIGGWTMGWLVLLCAHRIVTFHPQPKRILKILGIEKKTHVIPTGIDSAQYQTTKQLNNKITVTYIGRLESVKGVDDFLAAATPLKSDFPHLDIQVVGWYTDPHPLVEQYHSAVRFTGLRDDVPDILANTDIFVLPSYSEGLSNALMEAMSSSCACIASDVGGNRYLIQNGISGLLFAPGDQEALRAHIRRLVEDSHKREHMGQAGRQRIEEMFDWKIVEKHYKILFTSSLL